MGLGPFPLTKIVLSIASACLTASLLGFLISSVFEWTKIRYDYSDTENNNDYAHRLYVCTMILWVGSIVLLIVSLFTIAFYYLQLFRCINREITVSSIGVIAFFVISLFCMIVAGLCISYSSSSNCQLIREIGTEHGQNSTEYREYISNQLKNVPLNRVEEWMNDFDKGRCEGYHLLVSIFLGIFCFMTLIFYYCIFIYEISSRCLTQDSLEDLGWF